MKFTAASRGSPCDSTAFLFFIVYFVFSCVTYVLGFDSTLPVSDNIKK